MRLVVFALAAILLLPAAPTAAQVTMADDAYTLLESASRAMASVETMRFSTTSETRLAGGSDLPISAGQPSAPGLTSWGEFQAPDRVRVVTDAGPLSQSFETITIGRMWTRAGSSPWRAATQGPTGIAEQLREATRILVTPTVSEEGADYIVLAELDFGRPGADGAPVGSLFGAAFGGLAVPGMESGGNAVAVFTIEKATFYLKRVSVTTPMTPPGGGGFLLPSGMSSSTLLTMWDFDDPSIVVAEPR